MKDIGESLAVRKRKCEILGICTLAVGEKGAVRCNEAWFTFLISGRK